MRVHRVALSSSVQERPRKLSRSGAGFTDALAERDESNAHKPPDDRALHAAARAHAPREGGDRRHRRCGRRGPAPVAELPQEHAARAQAREDHAEQLPGADGRRPKRRRADDGAPRKDEDKLHARQLHGQDQGRVAPGRPLLPARGHAFLVLLALLAPPALRGPCARSRRRGRRRRARQRELAGELLASGGPSWQGSMVGCVRRLEFHGTQGRIDGRVLLASGGPSWQGSMVGCVRRLEFHGKQGRKVVCVRHAYDGRCCVCSPSPSREEKNKNLLGLLQQYSCSKTL